MWRSLVWSFGDRNRVQGGSGREKGRSGLDSILVGYPLGMGVRYLSSLACTFFFKIWRLDWKSMNEFSVMQQLGLCKDEEIFCERKVGTR